MIIVQSTKVATTKEDSEVRQSYIRRRLSINATPRPSILTSNQITCKVT